VSHTFQAIPSSNITFIILHVPHQSHQPTSTQLTTTAISYCKWHIYKVFIESSRAPRIHFERQTESNNQRINAIHTKQ